MKGLPFFVISSHVEAGLVTNNSSTCCYPQAGTQKNPAQSALRPPSTNWLLISELPNPPGPTFHSCKSRDQASVTLEFTKHVPEAGKRWRTPENPKLQRNSWFTQNSKHLYSKSREPDI